MNEAVRSIVARLAAPIWERRRRRREREAARDLLEALGAPVEDEIGCDEVYELMDRYADIVSSGGDPAVLLPEVHRHLEHCGCCRDELEALLRAITPPDGPASS